jgi:hypothetical protein
MQYKLETTLRTYMPFKLQPADVCSWYPVDINKDPKQTGKREDRTTKREGYRLSIQRGILWYESILL